MTPLTGGKNCRSRHSLYVCFPALTPVTWWVWDFDWLSGLKRNQSSFGVGNFSCSFWKERCLILGWVLYVCSHVSKYHKSQIFNSNTKIPLPRLRKFATKQATGRLRIILQDNSKTRLVEADKSQNILTEKVS